MQPNSSRKRSTLLNRSHITPSRSDRIHSIFYDAKHDFSAIANSRSGRLVRPAEIPYLLFRSSPAKHVVEDRDGHQHVVEIKPDGSLEQAQPQRFPSISSDTQYDFHSRFPNPNSYFVPVEDEPHPLPHSPTPAHRQRMNVRSVPPVTNREAVASPGKEPVSSGFNSPNDPDTAPLYHKPTHTVYHINNAATFASSDKSEGGPTAEDHANTTKHEGSEHLFNHREKHVTIRTWLNDVQEPHRPRRNVPFEDVTQECLNNVAPLERYCVQSLHNTESQYYRHHQRTTIAEKENIAPSSLHGSITDLPHEFDLSSSRSSAAARSRESLTSRYFSYPNATHGSMPPPSTPEHNPARLISYQRCRRQHQQTYSNPDLDQREFPSLPTPSPLPGRNAGSYGNTRPTARPGTPIRGISSNRGQLKRRRTGGNAAAAKCASDGDRSALHANALSPQQRSSGYTVRVGVGAVNSPRLCSDEKLIASQNGVGRSAAGVSATSAFSGEPGLATILSEPDDEANGMALGQGQEGIREGEGEVFEEEVAELSPSVTPYRKGKGPRMQRRGSYWDVDILPAQKRG